MEQEGALLEAREASMTNRTVVCTWNRLLGNLVA